MEGSYGEGEGLLYLTMAKKNPKHPTHMWNTQVEDCDFFLNSEISQFISIPEIQKMKYFSVY